MTVVAAAGLLAGVGCGDGHDHSKHNHGTAQAAQTAEKVKDPVCGMTIDKSAAKADEEYKGGHYYFCSHECHSKFKDAPDKYAK
jgi:Cu+-exporting ATPase